MCSVTIFCNQTSRENGKDDMTISFSIFSFTVKKISENISYKYMLFTGREVRIGKNCAGGLENGPRPHVLETEGTVFPIRTDQGR